MRQLGISFFVTVMLMGLWSNESRAEGKGKLTDLSLYSDKCVATLKAALDQVEGLSDLRINQKDRSATFILKDKKATRELDAALKKAGFHGYYTLDKSVLVPEVTFNVLGGSIGTPKPRSRITLKNVHVCCDECKKAIVDNCKGAKVTFEGDGPTKTVKITGDKLDDNKLFKALEKAGFNIDIEKLELE